MLEAVAVMFTLIAQDAPAARESPQVLFWEKAAPLVAMDESDKEAVPTLDNVTVLVTPVSPTASVKDNKDVESEPLGALAVVPVPDSDTLKLVPLVWLTVTRPVRAPGTVGVKITLKEQALPDGRDRGETSAKYCGQVEV